MLRCGPPLRRRPRRFDDGVDGRWVVEPGGDLHRAHPEVLGDEVLVRFARSRTGPRPPIRRPRRSTRRPPRRRPPRRRPRRRRPPGRRGRSPPAAATPTSASTVCTAPAPAPTASATTRPGSGCDHAPFGTPTQPTRASRSTAPASSAARRTASTMSSVTVGTGPSAGRCENAATPTTTGRVERAHLLQLNVFADLEDLVGGELEEPGGAVGAAVQQRVELLEGGVHAPRRRRRPAPTRGRRSR